MATKKISQFYQNPSASTSMKFLMYDPTNRSSALQDQIIAFPVIQNLLTAGIQVTIVSLTNSINTLSTQLSGKLDANQKGVAGGVVAFPSGSTIISPANLPFSLSSLVGTWDASTNIPTLSDGTGVDKTAYIVSVGGSQNLGSGSITVVAGNIIIHLGGTWQKVNTSVVLGVTTVNGMVGDVLLDTGNLPEVPDFRFVTDDILAALAGTAGSPSGLNKFVTDADPRLSGTNITVNGNPFSTVNQYNVRDIDSGNSTTGAMTPAALGISGTDCNTLFPAVFAEYGSISNGSVTYDECVTVQALLDCRNKGIPNLLFPGKQYNYTLSFGGGQLPIPKTLNTVTAQTGSLKFSMYGFGTSMRLRASGAGKHFLLREPTNESDSQAIAPYGILIDGFKFEGDNDPTFTGIRLCSTKNSRVSNCIFRSMGTGLEMRFCLSVTLDTNRYFGCNQRSIYLGAGDWSGASPSSSTTQALCLNQYLGIPIAANGFEIINTDSCVILGGVWENSVIGHAGVYYSNQFTTVCKDLRIAFVHVEQNYSEAAVYAVCQDSGIISIQDIFEQNVSYLLSSNSVSGTNRFVIKRVCKSGGFQFRNQGGAGTAISFEDVKLPGNPTTAAGVIDPLNAVFDLSGSYIAPSVGRIKINPLTL